MRAPFCSLHWQWRCCVARIVNLLLFRLAEGEAPASLPEAGLVVLRTFLSVCFSYPIWFWPFCLWNGSWILGWWSTKTNDDSKTGTSEPWISGLWQTTSIMGISLMFLIFPKINWSVFMSVLFPFFLLYILLQNPDLFPVLTFGYLYLECEYFKQIMVRRLLHHWQLKLNNTWIWSDILYRKNREHDL